MASQRQSNPLSRDDYVIGWISALTIESAAAVLMLDEEHGDLSIAKGDSNTYSLGRIGTHNIVMACMNQAGGVPANTVATNLMKSFRNVRYILMVGIGGGIPSTKYEVRLGDIVVSEPTGRSPGVVQSDFGKWEVDGFKIRGSLNRPAEGLIRAVGAVKREELLGRTPGNTKAGTMITSIEKIRCHVTIDPASNAHRKHQIQKFITVSLLLEARL
ncbi:hypothetical protein TWF679_008963 [Orbilia oligospora]|uniref:Nucleoside phosphorylase domain-containing protein n=1 Tax=Orbilia oligospora TaxID=2813651 RepID=A0A8H8VK04_ORBOL|nr:hypothetical protein TWF679_008963 [Orbilia oligospora]